MSGVGVEGELKFELVDFGVELELIERGGVELLFEGVDLLVELLVEGFEVPGLILGEFEVVVGRLDFGVFVLNQFL